MSATHGDSDQPTKYISPLATRNASPEMQQLWSAQHKHSTWRRLWLALAESEKEIGLDITDEQIEQMRAHLDDIDFHSVAEHEARLRHDVMAHIHAFGEVAPKARPIIHLGATSQFVNCNTELMQIRDSLRLIAGKIANVIVSLADFANEYRDTPTLGMTHYQPAQPTTVGKRAAVWAYDLSLTLEDIEFKLDRLRIRGIKGATGTQASFLNLLDGDETKVEQLDRLVVEKLGFEPDQRFSVTGQTYPRLLDAQILGALSTTAAVIHKMCNDIRLLSNRKEIDEPFGSSQVGSSAMPYKRNPMRCERATGLSRFVMSLVHNALDTAATQWLERTLDDSSNRRLSLPESFLALDGALDLAHNIASGLIVHRKTIHANLMAELPFMATENLLMAAVKKGADRQQAHEIIRCHSQAAGQRVKEEGLENDLLDRLKQEPLFTKVDFDQVMNPSDYIGLAPIQVEQFIEKIVEPIRTRYADILKSAEEPSV